MEGTDSIRTIKGVGEKSEKLFAKVGVTNVEELLSYYPREYDIFTKIQPISSVREGETVVLEGSFGDRPRMANARGLRIISAKFQDASGKLQVSWFNMPYLMRSLKMGKRYILRGRIVQKNGMLQMAQPKMLTEQEYANLLGKLQPVYPLTAGLTNHAVTKAVAQALGEYDFGTDFLPLEIRKKYGLLLRKKAVRQLHFPDSKEAYGEARRRIVFEEFFLFSLALHYMKMHKKVNPSKYILLPGERTEGLLNVLPFELTEGQRKAWEQVRRDLASGTVMNRLVQGDVGSGKTVIALLALLCAGESGHQGAMMVPTEVLAVQHYEEFQKYLEPLGIRVALLTGSMSAGAKREVKAEIARGEVDIVLGTHALIWEDVAFRDLALVVTDEQHRFGVRQREHFSEKGNHPHILVMSATPIPRTLAIILYGDLDVSVMEGLPAERLPIKNCAVETSYRPQAYRFMQRQVGEGHQAYIICPMVEESENTEAENVLDYAASLREVMPPSVRIAHLHGKMRPAQKNQIMEDFAAGEIDILVSTTVIEVGINVPNATVMMIENAERFGLAQLHQLRGRVGRGKAQSYCIFMAGNPSKETMERLRVIEGSNDGFYVARKDLELRGPGDLFGIRQSGDLFFQLADIYQDARELQEANEAACAFTREEISLLCKKYRGLRMKLEEYTGEPLL
ncbi:MAG: ATP-dependent DNA helicase RecG [Lachnospiraceae bacterium]|nr:ATP-dependent DNA helicase RecG [Lachnospiraceae bacterium]